MRPEAALATVQGSALLWQSLRNERKQEMQNPVVLGTFRGILLSLFPRVVLTAR